MNIYVEKHLLRPWRTFSLCFIKGWSHKACIFNFTAVPLHLGCLMKWYDHRSSTVAISIFPESMNLPMKQFKEKTGLLLAGWTIWGTIWRLSNHAGQLMDNLMYNWMAWQSSCLIWNHPLITADTRNYPVHVREEEEMSAWFLQVIIISQLFLHFWEKMEKRNPIQCSYLALFLSFCILVRPT